MRHFEFKGIKNNINTERMKNTAAVLEDIAGLQIRLTGTDLEVLRRGLASTTWGIVASLEKCDNLEYAQDGIFILKDFKEFEKYVCGCRLFKEQHDLLKEFYIKLISEYRRLNVGE